MTGRRFRFLLLFAVFLTGTALPFLSCSGSEPEKNPQEQEGSLPYDMRVGLQYFPGSAEGPGCMRVTLFRIPPDPGSLSTEVSFQWERRPDLFTFETVSEGIPVSMGQEVSLVSSPDEKTGELEPTGQFVWVFRLDGAGKPPPGTRIRAVLHYKEQSLASNVVTVPDLPKAQGDFFSLQRQARVATLLGDEEQLLRLSGLLIKERPDAFAGYWFQSLALEKSGKTEEALRAAGSALERLPNPDRPTAAPGGRGHLDTSGEIYRHIRRLQDSLVEK